MSQPGPRASWLAMATLLAACAEDGEPYRNPDGAFRLRYPIEWSLVHERGAVVFRPPQGRGSLAVTAAGRQEPGRPRSLQSVRPALLEQYGTMPGFRLLAERAAPLDGKRGFIFQVAFDDGGASWRRRQHVVEGRRFLVYVDCNAPARDFAAFEPACRAIQQTLRIEEE